MDVKSNEDQLTSRPSLKLAQQIQSPPTLSTDGIGGVQLTENKLIISLEEEAPDQDEDDEAKQ